MPDHTPQASSEIYFSTSYTEEYILLQVKDEFLEKPLCIKPSSSNATVLCTDIATYSLKDVQQSNSLIFFSPVEPGADLMLQGESASWLESTLIPKPRINLSQVPVYDGSGSPSGMSSGALFSSTPASNAEIRSSLRNNLCLELDYGYVKLQNAYVLKLLKLLINTILAEGLELSRLSQESILPLIEAEEERTDVLFFLFTRFSRESGTNSTDNHASRAIDTHELIKYTGISVLQEFATQQSISITKFLTLWSQATPIQLQSHCKELTVLAGHYIHPVPSQIQHFETSRLSLDPKQRIKELLEVKDRWKDSEIATYLEEIAPDAKAIQSILLKHTSKVKVGATTFIERRGK